MTKTARKPAGKLNASEKAAANRSARRSVAADEAVASTKKAAVKMRRSARMPSDKEAAVRFADQNADNLVALRNRWKDEAQYEDFADYAKAMRKLVPRGWKFIQASQKPFGFSFQTESGAAFALRVVNDYTRVSPVAGSAPRAANKPVRTRATPKAQAKVALPFNGRRAKKAHPDDAFIGTDSSVTLRALKDMLPRLDEADLRELNKSAVSLIRQGFRDKQARAAAQFHIGQKVAFISTKRGRGKVEGKILRMASKTVTLETADGQKWRVSPSMLSAA